MSLKKFFTKKSGLLVAICFFMLTVFALPPTADANDPAVVGSSPTGYILPTGSDRGITAAEGQSRSFRMRNAEGNWLVFVGSNEINATKILANGDISNEVRIIEANPRGVRYDEKTRKFYYNRTDASGNSVSRALDKNNLMGYDASQTRDHMGPLDKLGSSFDDFKDQFSWAKIQESIIKFIAELIMTIGSLVLGIAGWFLDETLKITVFNLSDTLGSGASSNGGISGIGNFINIAWTFFRDIANILFIFLILVVAIKTIIGGSLTGQKKALSRIIIVALLINFSLFFTKLVIDVSNIATVGIYNSFVTDSLGGTDTGIANAAAGFLGVQTFYTARGAQSIIAEKSGINKIIVAFFALIIMLVTASVFLAATFLFIARFFVFILAMIFSPIALVSTIIPTGDSFFKKWQKALLSNALFAPVFFLLIYITFLFASNTLKTETAEGLFTEIGTSGENGFSEGFLYLLFNYIMVMAFLFMSIFVSKKVGAAGSGGAMSIMSTGTKILGGTSFGLAARFGRGTIGRAGNALANSSRVKNLEASSSFFGRSLGGALKNIGDSGAKASFDGRNTGISKLLKDVDLGKNEAGNKGYANVQKEKIKEIEAQHKRLGEKTNQEKDAEKVRDGAAIAKYLGEKEANDKLKEMKEEMRESGISTVSVNGVERNIDELISESNTLITSAKAEMEEKIGDTSGKKLAKFQKDNTKEEINKYNKFNSNSQKEYLEKQTKIAEKSGTRQERFLKTISGENKTWYGKMIDRIVIDEHGNDRGNGRLHGGAVLAHWALSGEALGRTSRTTNRAATEQIATNNSTRGQDQAALRRLIASQTPPPPDTPPAPAPTS